VFFVFGTLSLKDAHPLYGGKGESLKGLGIVERFGVHITLHHISPTTCIYLANGRDVLLDWKKIPLCDFGKAAFCFSESF